MGGPEDDSFRDFVDYDSNLISSHGLHKRRPLKRYCAYNSDSAGQCNFCLRKILWPERYDGGNIGDSWSAMG